MGAVEVVQGDVVWPGGGVVGVAEVGRRGHRGRGGLAFLSGGGAAADLHGGRGETELRQWRERRGWADRRRRGKRAGATTPRSLGSASLSRKFKSAQARGGFNGALLQISPQSGADVLTGHRLLRQ